PESRMSGRAGSNRSAGRGRGRVARARMTLGGVAIVVAFGATARAEPNRDEAFRKGRELMKAGRYAEACLQFELSEKLDPELGTQFNIAQCDEKTGKLATALALYKELSAKDTNAQRRATEIDLAAQLEHRVPKVVVQMATVPPGVQVTAAGGGATRTI